MDADIVERRSTVFGADLNLKVLDQSKNELEFTGYALSLLYVDEEDDELLTIKHGHFESGQLHAGQHIEYNITQDKAEIKII